MLRLLIVVFPLLGLLVLQPSEGAEVKMEGVIKAVNSEERTLTIERTTAKGTKELSLDVAEEAGDLVSLKAGDRVSFFFDSTLEEITKIGQSKGQTDRDNPSTAESSPPEDGVRGDCPNTQLGDDTLQAQYDGLWKAYSDTLEALAQSVEDELERLYDDAKEAGDLDLALQLKDLKKIFAETGRLGTIGGDEKTGKKKGESRPVEAIKKLVAKFDAGIAEARKSVGQGYKTLEVMLTKADNLEMALAIRKESQGLWASVPSPVPPKPQSGKASIVNLLDGLDVESGRSHDCWKMVGKCLQCTSEGVDLSSRFTFSNPQIEYLAKKGEYDLAFQVTIKHPPTRDKFASEVFLDLPGIPGSPSLILRDFGKSISPSQVSLAGSRETLVNGKNQPNIVVPSPVKLDGSSKVAVKVKVRRKGSSATVLLNGRPVIDCNQFPTNYPISESLRVMTTLNTLLTICDLTISEPEK